MQTKMVRNTMSGHVYPFDSGLLKNGSLPTFLEFITDDGKSIRESAYETVNVVSSVKRKRGRPRKVVI